MLVKQNDLFLRIQSNGIGNNSDIAASLLLLATATATTACIQYKQ